MRTTNLERALRTIAVAVCTATATALYLQHRWGKVGIFANAAADELTPLYSAYGPSHHSTYFEEWIIRDFFHDRRDGTFLDVGANDYERESNTYFLEHDLGWSGIGIDAQAEFADGYRRFRPHTTFIAAFVSDRADQSVTFYVPTGDSQTASIDRTQATLGGQSATGRQVPTVTLDQVLDARHIAHVDFVSMDIELSEPKALAGFDIERFRPELVCIEAHRSTRQAILTYFTEHRYVIVGKYLRADPLNLYFMPLAR